MTPDQVAQVAAGAGFKGDGLVKAVAVALAESGGNERATNTNSDKYRSIDRGLWQINSHWHPEVSAAQAFNPATAARHAFRISKGGTDWSQWSTWPLAASAQMGRALIAAGPYRGPSKPAPLVGSLTPGAAPQQPPAGMTQAGWKDWIADQLVTPEGKLWTPNGPVSPETLVGPSNMLAAASQGIALVAKAGAWLADSHNWARVAFVVGGGAALLIGAQQLAASGALGSTAASASAIPGKATNLIPVAKVAKVAGKAGKAAKAAK